MQTSKRRSEEKFPIFTGWWRCWCCCWNAIYPPRSVCFWIFPPFYYRLITFAQCAFILSEWTFALWLQRSLKFTWPNVNISAYGRVRVCVCGSDICKRCDVGCNFRTHKIDENFDEFFIWLNQTGQTSKNVWCDFVNTRNYPMRHFIHDQTTIANTLCRQVAMSASGSTQYNQNGILFAHLHIPSTDKRWNSDSLFLLLVPSLF